MTFEADLDLTQSSYRCNCSICRRTRFWPAVAKADEFRLLTGESELTKYVFNTKKNFHFFCKHCGVRAFGVGNDTPMGKMFGVNLGCLEGISEEELSRIPITYVDGMHDRFEPPPHSKHL
ncbi:MAG TPA: GFA family protein [Steroidobacteraceae bacterium]|nr:GFA family protein [Steroidobacteraceae bacterium]